MTYNGTLVMPSSYAVMDTDEMAYVDGGFKIKRSWAAAAIDVIALAICPTLAPIKFMGKYAAKLYVKKYLPKLVGWGAKAARAALGMSINVVNGSIGSLLFGNAWCFTSAGGVISFVLDIVDGRCDGYIGR